MTTPIARSLPPLQPGSLLSPRLYAHLVLEWPLASGSSCIGKDGAPSLANWPALDGRSACTRVGLPRRPYRYGSKDRRRHARRQHLPAGGSDLAVCPRLGHGNPDLEASQIAWRAVVGNPFEFTVGGKMDEMHGCPIQIKIGRVGPTGQAVGLESSPRDPARGTPAQFRWCDCRHRTRSNGIRSVGSGNRIWTLPNGTETLVCEMIFKNGLMAWSRSGRMRRDCRTLRLGRRRQRESRWDGRPH